MVAVCQAPSERNIFPRNNLRAEHADIVIKNDEFTIFLHARPFAGSSALRSSRPQGDLRIRNWAGHFIMTKLKILRITVLSTQSSQAFLLHITKRLQQRDPFVLSMQFVYYLRKNVPPLYSWQPRNYAKISGTEFVEYDRIESTREICFDPF